MHVHSNHVPLIGVSLKPDEVIEIQAQGGRGRPLSDRWETVAELKTMSTPVPSEVRGFAGLRYYLFISSLHGVEIPDHCWHEFGDAYVTSIRCVDSSGRVLYTMEESGYEAFLHDEITEGTNPLDAWLEHGNRKDYLTIWQH